MTLAVWCGAALFVVFSLTVHGLHVVGMATSFWVVTPTGHYGLWEGGVRKFHLPSNPPTPVHSGFVTGHLLVRLTSLTERWRAAQALTVTSVVAGLLANLVIVLRKVREDGRCLFGLSATLLLIAGCTGLVGVPLLCEGSECSSNGGFSFFFVLVPCCLYLVAASCAFFSSPKT